MISYLQIDKLTKSFGDLVLFEDITFGIAQGQKVGLIAKNGTGKTTLLNIIAGRRIMTAGRLCSEMICGLATWNRCRIIRTA